MPSKHLHKARSCGCSASNLLAKRVDGHVCKACWAAGSSIRKLSLIRLPHLQNYRLFVN